MASQDPYEIRYAPEAEADVLALRAYDRAKVLVGIEQHLTYEPRRVSRSRIKQRVKPFWSQYRLRIEDLRVYYDVDDVVRRVNVLRILEKTTGPTPKESP
jgi:mRNA-degrading endonuclease RelE of RelBE toxin-antitoxin system